MNFKLNVHCTNSEIKKPYNPTVFEAWIGKAYSIDIPSEIEGEEPSSMQVIDIQTKTTEILSAEDLNGNGAGVRTEERKFTFPANIVEQLFEGVDLVTGTPKVSIPAINQLLAQYYLVID